MLKPASACRLSASVGFHFLFLPLTRTPHSSSLLTFCRLRLCKSNAAGFHSAVSPEIRDHQGEGKEAARENISFSPNRKPCHPPQPHSPKLKITFSPFDSANNRCVVVYVCVSHRVTTLVSKPFFFFVCFFETCMSATITRLPSICSKANLTLRSRGLLKS